MSATKLSARENQILVHASKGWTDQAIARELGISVSTVNSYWVRIRGKLGHFNRTELVAGLLRRESDQHLSDLREANRDLESKVAGIVKEANDAASEPFFQLVLANLPEAVLVLSADLDVIYANARTEDLFGYGRGYLVGKAIQQFFPAPISESQVRVLRNIGVSFAQARIGFGEVFYLQKAAGFHFRIILMTQVVQLAHGKYILCICRSFLEELDRLRRRTDMWNESPN